MREFFNGFLCLFALYSPYLGRIRICCYFLLEKNIIIELDQFIRYITDFFSMDRMIVALNTLNFVNFIKIDGYFRVHWKVRFIGVDAIRSLQPIKMEFI